MIVNSLKTKVMVLGKKSNAVFSFNNSNIETCENYKYLGIVFNSVCRVNGNIFRDMAEYTSKKAMKTVFAVLKKCKSLGRLTPKIALNMFDTFVLPVLEYGCEIWATGESKTCIEAVQLKFLKMMLGVKRSTATVAVYAETGRFPLFLRQKVRIIKYWIRLERLRNDSIV